MLVAVQTLLFFRRSLLTICQRFLSSYYRQLSLVLIGPKDEEDEETDEEVFADYDDERGVAFFPPMYAQRYAAVSDCLMDERWAGKLHKVVDLGYHDLTFIKYLKDLPGVDYILGVDIESISLRCSSELLGSDGYAYKRETPLRIALFQGNAADPDYRLIGCDAVIAIEMIEHMLPHDLDRLVHNVFGFIKPWIAIFTTPNADFNVLFKNLEKNGLRRMDHLFEWTREQFHDWCSNIVSRYPQYTVLCKGIGPGPPDTLHLGCCSQMALFVSLNYQKQKDLDPNSLALVAKVPSSSHDTNIQHVIGWESSTSLLDRDVAPTGVVDSQNILFSDQSCITIYLTPSAYTLEELTYRDSTSQCNLDRELGRNYMMFDEEDSLRVVKPRRIHDEKCYIMEDLYSRLNCSTFHVKKFSKTTQNLMAKNDVDALAHTKDVVNEIGYLTKMLKFNKNSLEEYNKNGHIWYNINWGENAPYWNNYYQVVREYNYPFESQSEESRILDLISEEITRLIDSQYDEEFSVDVYKLEIPLAHLMQVVRHITNDEDKVKDLLEWNGYEVVKDRVIHSRKVVENPSLASPEDDWNEDNFSDWDNTDTRSTTISDGSNLLNGRCLRRALDKKVRKLRSMMSADGDLSVELDTVVSRLMRLALWTCKGKEQPPAARWMQCKLLDLLALTEKSVTRRKKFIEQCYPMDAIPYIADYDGFSKYKDDYSVRLIESRYKELCYTPAGDSDNGITPTNMSREVNDQKKTQNWFEDDNIFEEISYVTDMSSPNSSIFSFDKSVQKFRRDDHLENHYLSGLDILAMGVTEPQEGYMKLKGDKKTEHELRKIKSSSSTSIPTVRNKRDTGGINDTLNSKRKRPNKKLHSTASKPIPGSLIELCHPELHTQNNKEEPKCFANHIQHSERQASECHKPPEKSVMDIIKDIAKQTAESEVDEERNALQQESLLASILNTHDDEFPNTAGNKQSQTIFLYDLNEPSTSKGVRHTSTDVQCGPDDSAPSYVMLSPENSVAEMPIMHGNGIKIEESISNPAKENFGPVCQRTVSPNKFHKGITIEDSETDLTKKPDDGVQFSTISAIEEYEHGTVFIMPQLYKTAVTDGNCIREKDIMKFGYDEINLDFKDFPEPHRNEEQKSKIGGFSIGADQEKTAGAKPSDAYRHGMARLTEKDESEYDSSQNKTSGYDISNQEDAEETYSSKTSLLLSNTLESSTEGNMLTFIPNNVEVDDSGSDFWGSISSPTNQYDLQYKKNTTDRFPIDSESKKLSKKSNLSSGVLHTHNYIGKQESEDVMYQGLWQKNFTCRKMKSSIAGNQSPEEITLWPKSVKKSNNLQGKYSKDLTLSSTEKVSGSPTLTTSMVNKHPKDNNLKEKSIIVMKENVMETIKLEDTKENVHKQRSKNLKESIVPDVKEIKENRPIQKSLSSNKSNVHDVKENMLKQTPSSSNKSKVPDMKENMPKQMPPNSKESIVTDKKENMAIQMSPSPNNTDVPDMKENMLKQRPPSPNKSKVHDMKENMPKPSSEEPNVPDSKENMPTQMSPSPNKSSVPDVKEKNMKQRSPTQNKTFPDSKKSADQTLKLISLNSTTRNFPNKKGLTDMTFRTRSLGPTTNIKKDMKQFTDMTLRRRSVSPTTTKKLDSKKRTEMTLRRQSISPVNKQNKTMEQPIPKKSNAELKRKPLLDIENTRLKISKQQPVKIEIAKPKKPTFKLKTSCTPVSSKATVSLITSKIRPVSTPKKSAVTSSYKYPNWIPPGKTPAPAHVAVKSSTEKIAKNKLKKNYIPGYLRRRKVQGDQNVLTTSFRSEITVRNNDSSLIIDPSNSENESVTRKSENVQSTTRTNVPESVDAESPKKDYVKEIVTTEHRKESLTFPSVVQCIEKVNTATPIPSVTRTNNNSQKKCQHHIGLESDNICSKDIETDILKFNNDALEMSYLVFRNELDNNVKSSTNCNATNSPRENSRRRTNRKLSSSALSRSSCSSPDSVVTVRIARTKSTKRYSTSPNKSSIANSESENTSPPRNRMYTKRLKTMHSDNGLADKENVPESSNASDNKTLASETNTFSGRKKNVFLVIATETPLVVNLPVGQSQTAANAYIKKTTSNKKKPTEIMLPGKSNDSSINAESQDQDSISSEISNNLIQPSGSIKLDSSIDINNSSTFEKTLTDSNVNCSISSTIRGLIVDRLGAINTSSCEIKKTTFCEVDPTREYDYPPPSHDEIVIPFESIVCNNDCDWSSSSVAATDSFCKYNTKTARLESDTLSMKSQISNYFSAENEGNNQSLTSEYFSADNEIMNLPLFEQPAASSIPAEPETKRASSVKDIFERKEPLTSPTPASGLAVQTFRGFSIKTTRIAGNKPDYVNLVDSETGSLAADYHNKQAVPTSALAAQAFSGFSMNAEPTSGDQPNYVNRIDSETGSLNADQRQTASEELFVSGRSSDSFQSCVLDEDVVIPSWLFEIIQEQQQQGAAAPSEQPREYFGPQPLEEIDSDLNNNPMEAVVDVTAGAGDGRGVHSDPSQDSSGRGTSLSSSDTSSGQTSAEFPVDPSGYGQLQLIREPNGSPGSLPIISLPGEAAVVSIRNRDSPGNDSEIMSTSRHESRRNRHSLFSDADADVSSLDTDVPDSS